MVRNRSCLCVLAMVMMGGRARGAGPALEGTWLVDSAMLHGFSQVSRVWRSELKIHEGRFALSGYCGMKGVLAGRVVLDPGGVKGAIDLESDAVDMSEVWPGVKYPNCTLPGIYKVEDGALTVCYVTGGKGERPREFVSENTDTYVVRFARERADFAGFPTEVRVTVVDEAGNAVAGAGVYVHAVFSDHKPGAQGKWGYYLLNTPKTDAKGATTVPYEKMASLALQARDAEEKRVGWTVVSPASAQGGTATVVLHAAHRVTGKITCEALTTLGKPLGWTNAMVFAGGQNAIDCESFAGDFSFDVPAGDYLLLAYGTQLPDKVVKVAVVDRDVQVPAVALEVSKLVLLQGERAPELENVTAWRGNAVKLAALRGKFVLLHFWGYWCGPCVREMPMWMKLEQEFRGKGVVVIGVHQDLDGEVDSVAAYEEKIAGLKEKLWEGKEPAFAMALTSGEHAAGKEGASEAYGIQYFPTTVLIDREGKVVRQFEARDEKDAEEQLGKLLATP